MEFLDRRDFVTRTAALVAGATFTPRHGWSQQDRRLGTCGPPPRQNPQRQTAAESFPPLPLPATPLRRSEPKAEPNPPLMVGKLEYGTSQDWNTDPGDVDNLMRHCREAMGLWYGWKPFPINELVSTYKAGKQVKIPLLYISGHEAFSFTPEQREAMRQYLHDGGTLFGDACCGRVEFSRSFHQEITALFPDRAFDLLQLDHPLFRAFYKYQTVHYLEREGAKKEHEAPPRILGMNLGSRTSILFTPFDMSCGWDEHIHPHGARLIPGDAIRLGINMISYVAALRQLAEAQAFTSEIQSPAQRPRQLFVLAQLKHHGDWNPDPNSNYQWLRHLANQSSLAVSFELKQVDADEGQIAAHPFLFMTGLRDPRLTDTQITAMRRHLDAGGFLFINNCSGYSEFDQHARITVKRLFPDQALGLLPPDHPLLHSLFNIKEGRDRQSGANRPVEIEGIMVKDRLVLAYSKNDMVSHLKQVSDPFGNGYDAESCRQLCVNMVAYSMQN